MGTTVSRMGLPDLRPFVVMLVDDYRDSREMFQHVLQTAGAKVIATPSTFRALAILRSLLPSIIVTNVEMPQIDGFSLAAVAREHPATHDVPMIAMTGIALDRQRQDWRTTGFARALVKPVDPFVLCTAVADVIAEATASKAIRSTRTLGTAVPVIGDTGTITLGAILRSHAAAQESCEVTRRLRAHSRDIREQASLVRTTAARVRAERQSRAAAHVA